MTQIIRNGNGGGGGKLENYVADVAYPNWEGESKAISGDKVYDKVSEMDSTLSTALQPGDNVSELDNDAGYITNAVDDLIYYYLKTDTYSQAEVNALIADFGGFEVVASLPTQDIKTNIIYLLGPIGTGADKYEEWIYASNNWVKIGETSVDLSNYYNKTEVDNLLAQKQAVISDLDTIRTGAGLGATAIQPNDNISELNNDEGYITDASVPKKVSELQNDSGYITKDVNNLTNYTKTEDLPDFDTYQLKSNMVTSLNSADNDHYPTAKAVKDAITASGGGDVTGPSSSVDGHLAVFDGATGKIIKDGGAIPTPTTVVDNLTTQSATSALSANQGYVLDGKISTINDKIPSEATSSNKLADKQFVNDAINSVTAYYITKDAAGNQFATYAELAAATTFYSGGVVRTPTRNDYTIVLADEDHDNACTRYIYNSGWEYQYTINESPLSQAQLDALNSGITSGKVSSYDSAVSTIAGYGNIVTHNTSEFATSTQGGKADSALQPNDNITELNNNAGYITGVDWGDIGGTLSDQVDLSNALGAKANNSDVVHTTGAETINGSKTFGTSPAVPSKSTDAGNNPTVIATEAQVAKKIGSSNSTYDNIVHLSQEEFEALQNKDPNTLYSTPDGEAGTFVDNTAFGSSWDGVTDKAPSMNAVYDKVSTIAEVPSGGTEGQVLTKGASGFGWADAGGGGVTSFSDWITWCETQGTAGYYSSSNDVGNQTYTTPGDGYLYAIDYAGTGSSGMYSIKMNGQPIFSGGVKSNVIGMSITVKKGDVFTYTNDTSCHGQLKFRLRVS